MKYVCVLRNFLFQYNYNVNFMTLIAPTINFHDYGVAKWP